MASAQSELEELGDEQNYLENYSRRNNVKIFGIPEKEDGKETWDESEMKAVEAIRSSLKIAEKLSVDRAHRVGKPRLQFRHIGGSKVRSQPRPIVGQGSKTRSSRKTRKPRRISFPRFSTPSFPFCTIPKTEKSELKTSEICSEVVSSNSEVLWSNPEVFNSDFSILHHTQNGKLGDENLGVFSNAV